MITTITERRVVEARRHRFAEDPQRPLALRLDRLGGEGIVDDDPVAAARGQAVFGEQVAAALLSQASSSPVAAPFPGLSERETAVLDLVAAGRANAEIAEALFVSPKTARNQVSSILTKLGCTRAEAIALARDAGLGRGHALPRT